MYLACGVGDHCANGQRITISVVDELADETPRVIDVPYWTDDYGYCKPLPGHDAGVHRPNGLVPIGAQVGQILNFKYSMHHDVWRLPTREAFDRATSPRRRCSPTATRAAAARSTRTSSASSRQRALASSSPRPGRSTSRARFTTTASTASASSSMSFPARCRRVEGGGGQRRDVCRRLCRRAARRIPVDWPPLLPV